MELPSPPQARRRSRSLIAAVGAAALVAVAVGVALSSHAQSRGVLASHMEQYRCAACRGVRAGVLLSLRVKH